MHTMYDIIGCNKLSRNVFGHLKLAEGINTDLIIKLPTAVDDTANDQSAEL